MTFLYNWSEESRIVAYTSSSFSSVEQRYAQIEKAALVLTLAYERLRDFIFGQHFLLETDHKPLVSLLET